MNITHVENTIQVTGIAIHTSNQEAAKTIPEHWNKFFSEGIAAQIDGKLSDDIYAVYTGFENEGFSNDGQYTFIIGVNVGTETEVPNGMVSISIPTGDYRVFDVEKGKPEKVFEKWIEIWGVDDFDKAYVCDFEKYSPEGDICINVGKK